MTGVAMPAAYPRSAMTLPGVVTRALFLGGPVPLAAATAGGDHTIATTIVTAVVTLVGVVTGPLLLDALRSRRRRSLARKDAEIRRLRQENKKLRRH